MKKIVIMMAMLMCLPQYVQAKCDVVAVVFDEKICWDDISVPLKNKVGRELTTDQQLRQENGRLSSQIRQIAMKHILPEGSYTATEAEISSFVEFSARAKEAQVRHNQELIDVIENLLATHRYSERNKKRLKSALVVFQTSAKQESKMIEDNKLRDEDMRKRFGEEAVKQMQERLKETPKKIATQWVSAWKMNKALFEHYGGRVIFQQAGIEPIDAYKNLLSDIKIKGKLQILNPVYKDAFADFERYLDMGHNGLSEPGERYFDRPYWETTNLERQHQEAIEEYKNIPHE